MIKGILVLYNNQKEELRKISMLKLPFSKESISKKSTLDFHEPEPCIIYETICRNKLGLELKEKVELTQSTGLLTIDNELFRDLEFNEEVVYAKFE